MVLGEYIVTGKKRSSKYADHVSRLEDNKKKYIFILFTWKALGISPWGNPKSKAIVKKYTNTRHAFHRGGRDKRNNFENSF
jgi:hypothetical protein